MELYITYEEYTILSGKIENEELFNKIARKAQHLLDYITFNRIPVVKEYTGEIPEVVKDVIVEFIDKSVTLTADGQEQDFDKNISQYSNGVETISYKLSTETEQAAEMKNLAYLWLPDYLTARGVSYDVVEYLQSESNNP